MNWKTHVPCAETEKAASGGEDRERFELRLPQLDSGGASPLALLSCQPQPAGAVWTRAEWTSLCNHLHNGNSPMHFVMGFRDKEGLKKYVRSKLLPVDRAISWAWSSFAGAPKSRLAFVPYSTNEAQQSRWGGLDFDAHGETIFGKKSGPSDRARELALAAFRVLLNLPGVAVILETSGSGGWHVWVISPDFHAIGEWVRLLKSVAALIGTVVASGVCEIYPPDSLPSRFGKGLRAPGCWNPSTDTCSEIVWENTHTSLENVLSRKSKTQPCSDSNLQKQFLDKERSISFSPPLYRQEQFQRFSITAARTRNDKLGSLVGDVFYQVGRGMAQRLAAEQFLIKTVATKASETEHMVSFEKLWQGMADKWTASLSTAEREIFARLETENERDGFRILRSFARKAEQDGKPDFPIVRDNLGQRLGITGNGAAGIRDKLVTLGAIAKTANYVPNKFSARFKWLLSSAIVQPEAHDNGTP